MVIINADDFGFDADTAKATIDCFQRGVLTSASIMANMPATREAANFARAHPEFSFGVHLTYTWTTTEHPVMEARSIPSLVGNDGRFLTANRLRLAAIRGQVTVADIIQETSAQLGLIRDYGISISHVDSHCHLHKFSPFLEALRQVLPRFGIRRVRCLQNVYLHIPIARPVFWLTYGSSATLRRTFLTTDYMYMPASSGDYGWPKVIQRKLKRKGVLEVGIHPGCREIWRRREVEEAQRFAALCLVSNCKLITWQGVE